MEMSKKVVELKGYRDGLHLIIINSELPLHQLESAIIERLVNIGDSLSGMQISLDVGDRELEDEELLRIKELLNERYQIEIKQVNSNLQPKVKSEEKTDIKAAPAIQELLTYDTQTEDEDSENTRVIESTLRSGKRECFLEGNIVIVGDVNPGAEVIASGNVIVFGALKGMAHAGALGDNSAVIIALELRPIQLRIGKVINRPPAENLETDTSIPEIAKVENNVIKVSPYRENFNQAFSSF